MWSVDFCKTAASLRERASVNSLDEPERINTLFSEAVARYAEYAVLLAIVVKTGRVVFVFGTESPVIGAEHNSEQVRTDAIDRWKVCPNIVRIKHGAPASRLLPPCVQHGSQRRCGVYQPRAPIATLSVHRDEGRPSRTPIAGARSRDRYSHETCRGDGSLR